MPFPHVVARFNKRVTNRFVEPVARRTSGFAVVHHVGRQTGAVYRTPVNVFRLDGDLVVALTYGMRADWIQNVLVGPASIETDGSVTPIGRVEVVGRATAWRALPWFVRSALRLLRVRDFARLALATS